MSDLHERIEAEVTRRLEVTRAASVGPWVVDLTPAPDRAIESGDHTVVEVMPCPEHPDRLDSDATHIALHDPADAVRRYEYALRVLARHVPVPEPGWSKPVCAYEREADDGGLIENEKCVEILDLAASLGIEVTP